MIEWKRGSDDHRIYHDTSSGGVSGVSISGQRADYIYMNEIDKS